jgi:hypothetical protein
LSGAYLGGPSLFLVALCLAATAALARASYCCRLTVPTAEGWKRRDEIEGLKLFLGVAEADRLRVLNPPDFTPALYEKLLPYAVALGVEMVWSRRFAAALAASQIQYEPDWYDGSHPWNRSDTADFSSDLGGGLSTAIAAASTAIAAASTAPSSSGGWSGGSDGGSGDGGWWRRRLGLVAPAPSTTQTWCGRSARPPTATDTSVRYCVARRFTRCTVTGPRIASSPKSAPDTARPWRVVSAAPPR